MEQLKFKYHLKNDNLLTEFEGVCVYYTEKQILAFKESDGTQVSLINHLLQGQVNKEFGDVISHQS